MLNKMFRQINLLERSMDATWMRQEVISQNIANSDTPGYNAKRVMFEDEFAKALLGSRCPFEEKMTREKHIRFHDHQQVDPTTLRAQVREDTHYAMRMDDNNVDIDTEMTNLAKNTIQYNALITSANSEIAKLKLVIREGR